MSYSQYYGNQSQAMGQQYNSDGTSQLFFNGNRHQQKARNQNDQILDDWSDHAPRQNDQHGQKLYDVNTANRVHQQENHQEVFENSVPGGQNQNFHPVPNTNNPSEPDKLVEPSYQEGPYQKIKCNQFAHQQPGPQDRLMHQHFGGPNRPIAHYTEEKQFIDNSLVQIEPTQPAEQYLPHQENQHHCATNLSSQQLLNSNAPLRIEHMALDQPGPSYLEIGVLTPQQMKESPRTQQLTLQMEQHTLQSSSKNNMEQAPSEAQQLTHQLFQIAQNGLLPLEYQAGSEEPEEPVQNWNNEEDELWEPMEGLDEDGYVPAEGMYGNNESDEEWFQLESSDCNSQVSISSTNTASFVHFSMDNNEVPLPLVRTKTRAPRGKNIPKVSTSRQTSRENIERRERALQLSPPAELSKEVKARSSRLENTPKRERNRGYTNTYNVKKKKISEDAKRESEEAFDKVQELKESVLQKEEKARFAIKVLAIMGTQVENEEGRYKKERKEKIEEFDAKERDDGFKDAETAEQQAVFMFETAAVLVEAKEENASVKTRTLRDLELKSHLLAKLVQEHEYKRELKLQRPVHNYVCRTVGKLRPFLDPPFRFQLERKMQEHEILDQLPDFERFALSYQNPFKRATEQEDKIK